LASKSTVEAVDTRFAAKNRLAVLSEEMDGIHFVNLLYWEDGADATRKARAGYERRQRRLEEIRGELFHLSSFGPLSSGI
jgi:hypothetical protein